MWIFSFLDDKKRFFINNMYQQIIIANKEEDSSERIIEIFWPDRERFLDIYIYAHTCMLHKIHIIFFSINIYNRDN